MSFFLATSTPTVISDGDSPTEVVGADPFGDVSDSTYVRLYGKASSPRGLVRAALETLVVPPGETVVDLVLHLRAASNAGASSAGISGMGLRTSSGSSTFFDWASITPVGTIPTDGSTVERTLSAVELDDDFGGGGTYIATWISQLETEAMVLQASSAQGAGGHYITVYDFRLEVITTGGGDPEPPAITSIWPNRGFAGSEATITGTGFSTATGVTIGGTSASHAVDSDTQITVTAPSGPTLGAKAVVVTNPDGADDTTFTYLSPGNIDLTTVHEIGGDDSDWSGVIDGLEVKTDPASPIYPNYYFDVILPTAWDYTKTYDVEINCSFPPGEEDDILFAFYSCPSADDAGYAAASWWGVLFLEGDGLFVDGVWSGQIGPDDFTNAESEGHYYWIVEVGPGPAVLHSLSITEVTDPGDAAYTIEVELEEEAVIDVEAESEELSTDLILQLHDSYIESAPGAITVSIVDAGNTADIHFEVDGEEVFVIEPDPDGGLDLATIPIPDIVVAGEHIMQPGTHTLTAIQGGAMGSGTFQVVNPPVPAFLGPTSDAPPVFVPGSVQPTGHARWVFQDLTPGGLGTWILPMNPITSTPPIASRALTVDVTSAGNKFHIYEDTYTPEEWAFSGVCPNLEMVEKFKEYYELNRRWYLHDHRSRAWIVTFQSFDYTPRLSTNWDRDQTEEFHDYEAVVLVMHPEWMQLSESP